jgi:hypothetical protein
MRRASYRSCAQRFQPQRSRQYPIGKAAITHTYPLELRIKHRASVIHAGHPAADRVPPEILAFGKKVVLPAGNRLSPLTRAAVPKLGSLDGVLKCFFQNAFADGADHEPEKPTSKVFTVAYNHDINVGCPVGMTGEGVGVARCAPHRFESVVLRMTRWGSDQS